MEDYELRKLESKDYSSQYFALLRQLTSCNEEKISEQFFVDFVESLSSHHQIWLIIQKSTKRIVGTGTVWIEQKIIHNMGKVGHIEDIVIDSMCRGIGLGEWLVRHLKEIAFQMRCYKVILNCTEDRKGFYQRCGFGQNGIMMDSRV